MSERSEKDPAENAPGVFGNLPSTRPGSRSPRRDRKRAAKPRQNAAPKAEAAAAERPDAQPPRAKAETAGEREAPARGPQAGAPRAEGSAGPAPTGPRARIESVEDLAWAGVAVAATAATAGVRLLSRAMDVLRPPRQRP